MATEHAPGPRRPMLLPARVNPLWIHPAERRLSLAGEWRFGLDPEDAGLAQRWFAHPDALPERIRVPGSWQGQGFGAETEQEVWDFRLRARTFRAAYTGTGWYARAFHVPPEWDGRRLWLHFGGAHPSAEVWLNGERLGENDLPFVPFAFDATGVARAGAENHVVVRVHEHHREFGLAYNWQGDWSGLYRGVELTATGPAWIEQLQLQPDADTGRLTVVTRVGGGLAGGPPLLLRVTVAPAQRVPAGLSGEAPAGAGPAGVSEDVSAGAGPAEGAPAVASVEIPVEIGPSVFALDVPSPLRWSPDSPALYRVDAELACGAAVCDALVERTGFVRLSAEGHHLCVNGEPYYLRGTGDFLSCPETGCPDTDRDRWRRKLRALRDYGYNQVRCQSYVYAPEYFDAADEVGLLVQSEMGMLGGWSGHSAWHVYQWPQPTPEKYPILKRQWDLVVARDANHPSAAMYCMSNEWGAALYPRVAWQCYRDTKAIKPSAMVIWTDGGFNEAMPADFINANFPPERVAQGDKPVIEHEFRWWSSFPDVRAAGKYTGAIRPYAAEIAREAARRQGQEHLLETYAANSQRLQWMEAKVKMEACRRDSPHLAGISHFNAMDANPSPQGVLDEFYERKLVDAPTWLQSNGDTVVLSSLGFEDRVLLAGGEFRCALFVSDFAHPAFRQPALQWELVAGEHVTYPGAPEPAQGEVVPGGRPFCSGTLEWGHAPYVTCPAGEVRFPVPAVERLCRAELRAALSEGGRVVTNAWDLWLFPREAPLPPGAALRGPAQYTWLRDWTELPVLPPDEPVAAPVVLAERLDEGLVAALREGGTVLLAASEGMVRPHVPNFGTVRYFFTPPANYGPYEDGQNGTVILDHPMLGDFSHVGLAEWQFFRLMENAPPLDLAAFGLEDADPVIRVIHRYPVCRPLAYLLERRVGAGRLIVSALHLDPSWPEARCLLRSLVEYALGPGQPAPALSEQSLARIVEATCGLG